MNNFNPNPNNGYNPYFAQQYYAEQQKILYYKEKRKKEIRSLVGTGALLGLAILAYLLIQTVIVLILQRSEYYSLYETSSLFQNCFNIVAVHLTSMLIPFSLLALIKKKSLIGPLVPLEKLGALKTGAWVAFGMGCCMVANYATNFVILVVEKLGYKLSQPELLETDSILACIAVVVSTAVVPAIFEEFAFRCCALGVLKRYGKGFAVVAVSIVFGLIHGNAIQFMFAFLIGAVLGYITVKTGSVLPAMLIHGFNNGLSVMQEIINYAGGKTLSGNVVTTVYVIWLVLAVGALIYLALTKQFSSEPKAPKEPYALPLWGKFLCLVPGLIIPFRILIYLTSQYITKL